MPCTTINDECTVDETMYNDGVQRSLAFRSNSNTPLEMCRQLLSACVVKSTVHDPAKRPEGHEIVHRHQKFIMDAAELTGIRVEV